ncbi:MAG: hypothetical protein KKC68_02555 [Candidatus Thermoplasmatota archaeon]|nr:hypothetical protein [Candidatus Thermoplasmatota archaeon]MBU1940633.1 hypothetical protein [Candidatus Thermoplasmatota archaeon]
MTTNPFTDEVKNQLITTFENIKHIVQTHEHRSRAGLMLGLQELGATQQGFIGAYFPVSSNIIVINKTPLRRIIETKPALLQPYGFHVLLHEYIHSLGFLDEQTTQQKTYEISKHHFGENHIITLFSTDIRQFIPNLTYPIYGWKPQNAFPPIEIIQGFDRSHTDYYIT